MEEPKKRIEYIDVAKGVFIMCLFYGHSIIYGRILGVDEEATHLIGKTQLLYEGFFMQSFFLITGFCSSFKIPISVFIWKNIKTILLPGMLLSVLGNYIWSLLNGGEISSIVILLSKLSDWFLLGGEWFIIALFCSKLTLWFILKRNKHLQIVIVALIYIVGLTLNQIDIFPNYIWHRHTMLLIPYLYMGFLAKGNLEKIEPIMKPVALIGVVIIPVQVLLDIKGFYHMPFNDNGIHVSLLNFPIHYLNVFCGTAIVILISRTIEKCAFIKTLGMGSLLCYLWNGLLLMLFITLIRNIGFNPNEQYTGWIFYMIAVMLSYIAAYVLVLLVYNNKCLKWLVGKR